jgi:NTP pyrophosphatase (non-canonical NTP hydrolase)
MVIEISDEQKSALERGEAVRVRTGDMGDVVVISARMASGDLDADEQRAWAEVAKKALNHWGRANPFDP